MITYILYFAAGLLVATLLVAAFYKKRIASILSDFSEKEKNILSQHAELDKQKSIIEATYKHLTEEHIRIQNLLAQERETSLQQSALIATFQNENKNLIEKIQVQKTEVEELQKRLTSEFENIANKILKEEPVNFLFPIKKILENYSIL
jgi:DNA recombination protein RmuC